jgi:hypothetical protein
MLGQEREWLSDIEANCVLSDASFLGWYVFLLLLHARIHHDVHLLSLAAKSAGLPSVLVTNFTFDSVYSYLSTTIAKPLNPSPASSFAEAFIKDGPVAPETLSPLVDQLYAGYCCADLLVLLPGAVPIPAFHKFAPLPSTRWIDPILNNFHADIVASLSRSSLSSPFSRPSRGEIMHAPLLVRPTTSSPDASPYGPAGRARILASLGVPSHLHDPTHTRVLVVSFGGQIVRRPRSGSMSGSMSRRDSRQTPREGVNGYSSHSTPTPTGDFLSSSLLEALPPLPHRLTTPSHLWVPGAPPASIFAPDAKPNGALPIPGAKTENVVVPEPYFDVVIEDFDKDSESEPGMLPDESWIAIVCGVSKEQWMAEQHEEEDGLPEGFYVAPTDVYMPDLTAVGDVLLGKLVSVRFLLEWGDL